MKTNFFRSRVSGFFAVTALLFVTSGCALLKPAQTESHYYVLTSTGPAKALTRGKGSDAGCVVRLAPVEVADYLGTRSMAVRGGTNEVHFNLFHQWAEPLNDGIRRVLAEDLRTRPQIRTVLTDQSAPSGEPVYAVSVHVLACEGVDAKPDGSAEFTAVWEIARQDSPQRVIAHGIFQSPRLAWRSGDYNGLAAKLSRALGDFSRVLAGAVAAKTGTR